MADQTKYGCPDCGCELKHIHDCGYGIPETHMVGSERYECSCGFVERSSHNKHGLPFILDR